MVLKVGCTVGEGAGESVKWFIILDQDREMESNMELDLLKSLCSVDDSWMRAAARPTSSNTLHGSIQRGVFFAETGDAELCRGLSPILQ